MNNNNTYYQRNTEKMLEQAREYYEDNKDLKFDDIKV